MNEATPPDPLDPAGIPLSGEAYDPDRTVPLGTDLAGVPLPGAPQARGPEAASRDLFQGALPKPPEMWRPPSVEELSRFLPDYEILAILGRGGMGAVYKAIQKSLDRPVAIKLLPPELGADLEFEARFQREAKAMARLNHPNIIQIYDFGRTTGGHCYFVMEFVDGADLHHLIHRGQVTPDTALKLVIQVCEALQYAHDKGYVHRDIKPANILLTSEGVAKVGDFGLAKLIDPAQGTDADQLGLTMSGISMGTPNYMAPEQLVGREPVDHRADIYSLGVMFYERLTGEIPRGAFVPPSGKIPVDARVDDVVLKAMHEHPAERYQSARAVETDVNTIRTDPRGQTLAGRERTSKAIQRKKAKTSAKAKKADPLGILAIVVVGLSLVGGAGAWWWLNRPTPAPAAAVSTPEKSEKPAPVASPPVAPAVAAAAPRAWVKAFQPGDAVNPKGRWNGSWIEDAETILFTMAPKPVKNVALRMTIRTKAEGETPEFAGAIFLREKDNGAYAMRLHMNGWVNILHLPPRGPSSPSGGLDQVLKSVQLDPGTSDKDEWLLEFAAVGSQLFARVDGQLVATLTDTRLQEGKLRIQGLTRPVRDIEFINLDGLPEAEALRILGVEEKNPLALPSLDLPPAIAAMKARGGRLRSSGTTNSGAPLDLSAAGGIDDFVDVKFISPGDGEWVAWRRDGSLVIHSRNKAELAKGMKFSRSGWVTPEGDLRAFGWANQLKVFAAGLPPGSVRDFADGADHGVVLMKDGGLRLVDIGNPVRRFDWAVLEKPLSGIRDAVAVDWMTDAGMALRADGTVLAWHPKWGFTAPSQPVRDVVRFSAGGALFLTLSRNGSVQAWSPQGDNPAVKIPTFPKRVIDIRALVRSGAVQLEDGSWKAWGEDAGGVVARVNSIGRAIDLEWAGGHPGTTSHPVLWIEPVDNQPAAPAANATKEKPFENSLGMKFVPVPITGGPTDGKRVLFSVWETRVKDYEAFVKVTKREWTKPDFPHTGDHPAGNVVWDDAVAFCQWLTGEDRKVGRIGPNDIYRLPSDHEWSCAAGIGNQEDPSAPPQAKQSKVKGYHWGSAYPPPADAGNYFGEECKVLPGAPQAPLSGFRDGFPLTAPVGSFAPSALGLSDLGGNAWEWCSDAISPAIQIARGASCLDSNEVYLLSSYRALGPPSHRSGNRGFRCVLEIGSPRTTATPPKIDLPPALAAMKARGGRLRAWGTDERPEGGKPLDISAAEGLTDLVRIEADPVESGQGGWVAWRRDGTISRPETLQFDKNTRYQEFNRQLSLDDAGRFGGEIPKGQLGADFAKLFASVPQGNVVDVARAHFFAALLTRDGRVVAGSGNPTAGAKFTPEVVSAINATERAVEIEGGTYSLIVLLEDGTVRSFLNDRTLTPPAEAKDIVGVAAGQDFVIALGRTGKVIAWGGNNNDRQLSVPALPGRAVKLKAFHHIGAAQMEDGRWIAWGDNKAGVVDRINALGPVPDIGFMKTGVFWIEPVDAKPAPAQAESPRDTKLKPAEVARWVLAHQGKLKVGMGGDTTVIQSPEDIPAGNFKILEINLSTNTDPREPVTDADLEQHLTGLGDLKVLNLQGRNPYSGSFLQALTASRDLESLNIVEVSVSPDAIGRVAMFPKLRALRVNGGPAFCAAFAQLPPVATLDSVHFHGSVTPALIDSLSRHPSLTSLGLLNSRIEDDVLTAVARLSSVTYLELAGTFEGSAFAKLGGLPKLDKLALSGSGFAYPWLDIAAEFRPLRTLKLYKREALAEPAEFVKRLGQLKQLDSLELLATDGIPPDQLKLIQEALPKATVTVMK